MEMVLLLVLVIQLIVLWQSCQRQPINVYVYIDDDEPPTPTRLEGDEWKDGAEES